MANDASPSSASTDTIPYPTLTILYLPAEAEVAIEEISQRYNNKTARVSFTMEKKKIIKKSQFGAKVLIVYGLMR
jgi:hypothetical protein